MFMATQVVPQVSKLYYRPAEAAIVAGTSRAWIYARVADGSLPAVRLAGRMVRIKAEDLLRFLEAGRSVEEQTA
jgi:excisionase family DNA binding protein